MLRDLPNDADAHNARGRAIFISRHISRPSPPVHPTAGREGIDGLRAVRQRTWPLRTASLGAIGCHYVLTLLQPLERVLSEFARVLRPSGLVAAVPRSRGGREKDHPVIRVLGRFRQSAIRR